MDEPLHFVAALSHRFANDYRLDPEDPPSWEWLATVPLSSRSLPIDWGQSFDRILREPGIPMPFVDEQLWQRDPVASMTAIARSRMSMAILLPVLIVIGAWCAWKLARPVAAVIAAILLGFDPLLLGHAPLIKNDLSITLVTLAILIATVALMRRMTALRIVMFALLCVSR